MWNHAQRIAHTYPLRQRDLYIAAALSLRMPYWDAFADPEFPIAASLPTIIVNSPNGTQNLPNPLYNYTFHPADGGNRFPSENWVRCPWSLICDEVMLICASAIRIPFYFPPLGFDRPAEQRHRYRRSARTPIRWAVAAHLQALRFRVRLYQHVVHHLAWE